jgi:hypothetical protein
MFAPTAAQPGAAGAAKDIVIWSENGVRACELPRSTAETLDAVIAGLNSAQESPGNNLVKYGGSLHEDCVVESDGLTRVCCNFRHDQSRARKFDLNSYALRRDGLNAGGFLIERARGGRPRGETGLANL